MTETCANCRFFVPATEHAKSMGCDDAYCRRMPQRISKQPEDWCGEWAPSKATELTCQQCGKTNSKLWESAFTNKLTCWECTRQARFDEMVNNSLGMRRLPREP